MYLFASRQSHTSFNSVRNSHSNRMITNTYMCMLIKGCYPFELSDTAVW